MSETFSVNDEGNPSLNVSACQMRSAYLDVDANVSKINRKLDSLPPDIDAAIFPEYALTGFTDSEELYESAIPRESGKIEKIAEKVKATNTSALVNFVEKDYWGKEPDYYNTSIYMDPDGNRTFYRKRHLWKQEKDLLNPGDSRVVIETPPGKIGVMTCFDLNYVEESNALTREEVVGLFVNGAWKHDYSEAWRLLLRARAIDGVRWVVAAGQIGGVRTEDNGEYAGNSMVVKPTGEIAGSLDQEEKNLLAELDLKSVKKARELINIY
ncbi:MAG: carbon-nitrogen hydrolase family protein [Halobacteria archaeon]